MEKRARGFFFRTAIATYYYDDCSGVCFPCTPGLETSIETATTMTADRFAARENKTRWDDFIITRHQAYGAFFGDSLEDRRHAPISAAEMEDSVMDHGLQQLLLVVTDQCNLRCRYCVYSEHYPFAKEDPNGRMSFDTARKAVDSYFAALTRKKEQGGSERATINFYGGEPLMNFALIEQVVAYIAEHHPGETRFQVTTNGTMLTPEIADFLVRHRFLICISLDGPEEQHDRRRPLANQQGSFQRVLDNIESLWERHGAAATVAFLVTYDYSTDVHTLKEFFQSREELRKGMVLFNRVKSNFSTYFEQFDDSVRTRFNDSIKELRKTLDEEDPVTRSLLRTPFIMLLLRRMVMPLRTDMVAASSTCLPGHKICVHTDGSLETCERVHGMKIGDVEQGLDFPRIAGMMMEYNKKVLEKCSACPIQRMCSYCFAQFWDGKNFISSEQTTCEALVVGKKALLEQSFSLFEERPDLHKAWIAPLSRKRFSNA